MNSYVRMFPWLHNIEDFVKQSHPNFIPDTPEYISYWEGQEKLCLEGLWGYDYDRKKNQGGWRYMPPQLYWYINHTVIEDTEAGGDSDMGYPFLRDVDWIMAYGWFTARGFSGFEQDDKYTCSRVAQKIELNIELSPLEEKIYNMTKHNLLNKHGKLKKYIDAKEYLYATHRIPKGLPLYDNERLNFMLFGSRGFGKTFFASEGVVGHELVFFGKKQFNDDYLVDPKGSTVFVGAGSSDKSKDVIDRFVYNNDIFQKTGPGSYRRGKDFIPGYFYMNMEGSVAPGNGDNVYRHTFDYTDGSNWYTGGSNVKLRHGVFTKFNPQAAVGGRYPVIVADEIGLVEDLVTVHGANETTQIRRGYKFGSSWYSGTGGNLKKVQGSRTVFYDPYGFKMVPYKDKFENTGDTGCFIPAYLVDQIWKNEHGNTDYERAFKQEMFLRDEKKQSADDAAYLEHVMGRPIVPSEMFLNEDNARWPAEIVRKRLIHIISGKVFDKVAKCVKFKPRVDAPSGLELVPKEKAAPIIKYRSGGIANMKGSVVIYEHPPGDLPEPTYFNSLYKVVYDPVRKDDKGTSLAAILVYKGFTTSWEHGLQNTIVAEYIGRLNDLNSTHQIAVDLAEYYNCKVLFENNFNDFFRYCEQKNKLHLLQPTLHLISKTPIYKSNGDLNYGVTMTDGLKVIADQHGYSWLGEVRAVDKDGEPTKRTVDYLFSSRFLEEMINYDPQKNFDYISAMRILWLWLAHEKQMPIEQAIKQKELDKITAFYNKLVPVHIQTRFKTIGNGQNNDHRGSSGVPENIYSLEKKERKGLEILRGHGSTPGLDYWLAS